MIPLPFVIPAVVKELPWRLIGAVALVLVVALMGWRMSVWHDSHKALKATEKALATRTAEAQQCAARELIAAQAYAAAEGKAKAQAAADRATAERVENELQHKLAAADARGRDLARRLRNHAARTCAGGGAVSQPAGAATVAAGAAEEPGDGEAIERVTEDHFAACALDAEELSGWQDWWREVSAGR